jgi:hypothetical protein
MGGIGLKWITIDETTMNTFDHHTASSHYREQLTTARDQTVFFTLLAEKKHDIFRCVLSVVYGIPCTQCHGNVNLLPTCLIEVTCYKMREFSHFHGHTLDLKSLVTFLKL